MNPFDEADSLRMKMTWSVTAKKALATIYLDNMEVLFSGTYGTAIKKR
jgi:hypothetical protein